MDRTLIISGAAGFIARRVVEALKEDSHWTRIVLLDKLSPVSDLEDLKRRMTDRMSFHRLDLCKDDITPFLEEGCDILHLAAETHVDRSFSASESFFLNNVLGSLRLIEAFQQAKGGFFLHISTDEVYGPSEEQRTENDPFYPTSPYAISKAAADQFLQYQRRLQPDRFTILRSCNVYGIGQHREKFIPTILHSLKTQQDIPLYGDGSQRRHWLYVDDYALLLLQILRHRHAGVYNVSSPETLTNRQLIERILHLYRAFGHYQGKIKSVEDRPLHDQVYEMDGAHIREKLGWQAQTPLESGLQFTLREYFSLTQTP